ncbi:MAG TPA: tetratricopeptide repeat protein [Solimonas sp.]|nr:tetratricopeptide repeat protein [Solimonas sp.]
MSNPKHGTVLPFALTAVAAALLLGACGVQPIKGQTPRIGKAIGKLDQPLEAKLPIITSEPIANDPEKAADNYRKLLELEPDVDTKAEAKRRLADLNVQIEDTRGNTEESAKSIKESIKFYNELLNDRPEDPKNDRVFYQLARAYQNVGDVNAAIDTLKRLTERLPDSDLAGDAHFRRAELLFLTKRYDEAELEYKTVMDLKEATPFFEPSQYKYGWSQYKQSKFEEAIGTFFAILDRELPAGEQFETDKALSGVDKGKFDMAKDSLRVVTLSLIQLGGGKALNDYLSKHGDPRFYPLVYAALGESLLDKERFTDAANTYAAFIERYPQSPRAPAFQSRVIKAYAAGGFRDLVVTEKERYAVNYDPAAAYWGGKPATQEVLTELRTHLEDLAKHYHALAQQDPVKNKPVFLTAAKWYKRIIEVYPQDKRVAEINFLLGDALLDGGQTLEAAKEYAKTAYSYPAHTRAGEAAHASVLAYQKYAKEVSPAERAGGALRQAIDAGIKMADTFPGHPKTYPVLTQAALDLYELKSYDEAIKVAGRVLSAQVAVAAELRRTAWSVTGDSQFAQKRYPEAEKAFAEELKLTTPNSPAHAEVIEQLAASIYKQGEAARDAKDLRTAANQFLRVGQVTPQAKIRATADYDAGAALMQLEDWPKAAQVLEGFRSMFPGHALEADVDKKLAVAYQKDKKPALAAAAYRRISMRATESVDVRMEAAWLSATLYDEAKLPAETAQAYEAYVRQFPRPLARSMDARQRLMELATARGDAAGRLYWLRDIVAADDSAGGERTERTRSLAAKASLEIGRITAQQARALRLSTPVEKSLPAKKQAMEQSILALNKAATYGYAEITTAATYELGGLYQDFGKALMDSERPRNLGELELEQYNILLEEQAFPFEEKAIATHEANLKRITQGVYDEWVAKSAKALAAISPAKYGKREQGEDRYESLK